MTHGNFTKRKDEGTFQTWWPMQLRQSHAPRTQEWPSISNARSCHVNVVSIVNLISTVGALYLWPNTIEYHWISTNTIEYHWISTNTIEYHSIITNTIESLFSLNPMFIPRCYIHLRWRFSFKTPIMGAEGYPLADIFCHSGFARLP